jgi:hypothetical protein
MQRYIEEFWFLCIVMFIGYISGFTIAHSCLCRHSQSSTSHTDEASHLIQLTRNIRELALLQLGLPENRIRVAEAMLDPSVLLDMVQVDETTRVRVTMGSCQNTPSAKLERRVVFEIVLVFSVQYTVGKRLTGSDTEEVAGKARAVAVDVVEGGAFLGGYAGAHGSLGIMLVVVLGSGKWGVLPCSSPCLCTSIPSSLGSWRLRRRRCGACVEVRGDGIACRDMRASTGSPVYVSISRDVPPAHVYVQQRHQPWYPAGSC